LGTSPDPIEYSRYDEAEKKHNEETAIHLGSLYWMHGVAAVPANMGWWATPRSLLRELRQYPDEGD
jgi:hypothetical protein